MNQTRQTHRSVIVTQNGRASNVFLDVADYQQLINKVELLQDIYQGEKDISAGRVHSTADVRRAAMLLDEATIAELDDVKIPSTP